MRRRAGSAISSPTVGLDDIFERGGLPETASAVGSDLGPLTRRPQPNSA